MCSAVEGKVPITCKMRIMSTHEDTAEFARRLEVCLSSGTCKGHVKDVDQHLKDVCSVLVSCLNSGSTIWTVSLLHSGFPHCYRFIVHFTLNNSPFNFQNTRRPDVPCWLSMDVSAGA